jgi:hypothetical protein
LFDQGVDAGPAGIQTQMSLFVKALPLMIQAFEGGAIGGHGPTAVGGEAAH